MRFIIVGWGGISGNMTSFLRTKPWFDIVGVVDIRPEALTKAQETLSLTDEQLFTDLGVALDEADADGVIINTPSELHFEQAKQALQAGKHVLVAKPITNNLEDAVELVKLAGEKSVTISVGQQVRYNRHYTAVRRFIESGKLGRVEAMWFMNAKPRPNPANLANMSQPALYEMACHHFDSLMHILNDPQPQWISCDGFNPSWSPYAGPCMVNALIRFTGDLHVSYHGGFSSRAPMYELRIEGSEGALKCSGLHMSNDTMAYEFAPALGQFESITIDEDLPQQDPWLTYADIWHDYMNGGAEPPFSGRNNLKVFATLSAAVESVESNASVDLAKRQEFLAVM